MAETPAHPALRTRKQHRKPKIGIFGLGLTAYWPQFPTMKAQLERNQKMVEENLRKFPCHVVSAGIVDSDATALAAGELFCREVVDLIVCYLVTYGTSSLVLRTIQRRRVPVLVLNLQPSPALDYDHATTEEMLIYCSSCILPEISHLFSRARLEFNFVSGIIDPAHPAGGQAWKEIGWWMEAARVAHNVQTSRFGFLGHTYPGMLDMYTDLTACHIQLGTHVELLEMCDLQQRVDSVQGGEIRAKLEETRQVFVIAEDSPADPLATAPTEESLNWSARVACGMDGLVQDFALDGLAYYYRGLNDNQYERLGASLILGGSLLTAHGVPCSGEGDLKNCFAMYIVEVLGAGGSYTEFYAMDLNEQFMLMAHDGPGHVAISDRAPILRGLGLYHGKRGSGISVEFSVQHGPVTIVGMTQTSEGRLKLLVSQAESVPGATLRIGNTNSRIVFSKPPAEFLREWTRHGPTHHVALGIGHLAEKIEYAAKLLNLECARVAC